MLTRFKQAALYSAFIGSTLFAGQTMAAVILTLGPGGNAFLASNSAGGDTVLGYSISSTQLSPTGWQSLDSQGYDFNVTMANDFEISEQSLGNGLYIANGASVSIGRPFNFHADANGDGIINFPDFLILSENFGIETDQGELEGDFDLNGVVDFTDFELLEAMFGTTLEYQFNVDSVRGRIIERPSEVPVPAAAWLFGSALMGLAGMRRKK